MPEIILRNTSATLSNTFYVDETPTNATGNVTVTVYREDGSQLVAPATASQAATPNAGEYTTILAPQANLDRLRVEWSGIFGGATQKLETRVEVVGAFYASTSEIRALQGLSSTAKYPLAMIQQARTDAEETFESYCHRAFVPRYRRELLDGTATRTLPLHERDITAIQSIKQNGVALTTSEFTILPDGGLYWNNGIFDSTYKRNIEVKYEHGLDYCPSDIKRAFLIYVRYLLLEVYSRIPSRATGMNADGIYIQMALPGMNRCTGLPDVDSTLNQWRSPTLGIA